MSDQSARHETHHNWEQLTPEQVLQTLVFELYHPVSLLGSHLKRITDDDDPLTEEDTDEIFSQMHAAVRQLSKTVVNLRLYTKDKERQAHTAEPNPETQS